MMVTILAHYDVSLPLLDWLKEEGARVAVMTNRRKQGGWHLVIEASEATIAALRAAKWKVDDPRGDQEEKAPRKSRSSVK